MNYYKPAAALLAAALAAPLGALAALQADEAALHRCAAILQRVRPDILLLNEFDHEGEGVDERALTLFLQRYLGLSQQGDAPLDYPHHLQIPTNTGLLCGADLDGDGVIALPGDGLGFGAFPGQYGMALLSRFPLFPDQAISLRRFLWRDMPGALLPMGPDGVSSYYSPEALAQLPLSSKNHLLLPVQIGERTLQLLLSHPVPPVFDGPVLLEGLRIEPAALHGQRMVHDQLHGHDGVDRSRVTALLGNRIAQAGQIDQRGLAQDVVAHHARREPGEVALALAMDYLAEALAEDGRIAPTHQVLGMDAGGVGEPVPGAGGDGVHRLPGVEVVKLCAGQGLAILRVDHHLRSLSGTNLRSSGPT